MTATAGLRRLADEVAAVPRAVVPAAAEVVGAIAEDEARRATGDGRMSGMGPRGPRLRTVARVADRGQAVTATVAGVPAGGWAILESGARGHVITADRGRVLAGPRLRHPVRGAVRHPGMAGKRAWSAVVTRAGREVPELAADAVHEAVS